MYSFFQDENGNSSEETFLQLLPENHEGLFLIIGSWWHVRTLSQQPYIFEGNMLFDLCY